MHHTIYIRSVIFNDSISRCRHPVVKLEGERLVIDFILEVLD